MIKTSFTYFTHCSNLQKLTMLSTTRRKVLIILALLEKKKPVVFQDRILKHKYEENTKYCEQSQCFYGFW